MLFKRIEVYSVIFRTFIVAYVEVYKIQKRGNRARGKPREPQNRVNERIRARQVFVIDSDNKQLSAMLPREALQIAREKGLDLVEVSPNADPPVCKIMDYGKFQYEKSKRAKEAKKKQAKVILKELKFNSVRTGDHDFQFKMRHAREFLSNGWKVKITVRFKGREMAHTDLGRKMLQRFTDDIADIGEVEQSPRMETRTMFIILGPKSS